MEDGECQAVVVKVAATAGDPGAGRLGSNDDRGRDRGTGRAYRQANTEGSEDLLDLRHQNVGDPVRQIGLGSEGHRNDRLLDRLGRRGGDRNYCDK
jgi:hypothetical protein